MATERPTKTYTALLVAAVFVVVVAAILEAPSGNWDWGLFVTLLALSTISDILSVETESRMTISANFLALITAIVFLGGTPAALIGAISTGVAWFRIRESPTGLVVNILTFTAVPLAVGVVFDRLLSATGVTILGHCLLRLRLRGVRGRDHDELRDDRGHTLATSTARPS